MNKIMRATIYMETIEQYDDIRNIADLESISSHSVHNMKVVNEEGKK